MSIRRIQANHDIMRKTQAVVDPWARECWGRSVNITNRARRLERALIVRVALALMGRGELRGEDGGEISWTEGINNEKTLRCGNYFR